VRVSLAPGAEVPRHPRGLQPVLERSEAGGEDVDETVGDEYRNQEGEQRPVGPAETVAAGERCSCEHRREEEARRTPEPPRTPVLPLVQEGAHADGSDDLEHGP
jgi:hypothetical protein